MLLSIMSILYLVISTTSVSSMSSPETTSSSLASARQSPADVSAEKTFGLTLSAGSLPQLWANTSAVSTWAAVAGNLALVVAGAVLGHRLTDRGDTGKGEEGAGDTLQELDEARLAAEESLERLEIDSRDVDKILALLVQLKYGPGARGEQLLRDKLLVQDAAAEAEQASNRMDIHDFVTR